jgi:uncharacterized protein (TIGR03089 family)
MWYRVNVTDPTGPGPATVAALVDTATNASGRRPLLTFYDQDAGERTELSGATLANWVAKTANLLVDGCGLDPGAPVGVRLPPHWQTAGVLLGCWVAGLAVDTGDGPVDVCFVTADRLGDAFAGPVAPLQVFAMTLRAIPTPIQPPPPPGVLDFVVEVRGYADRYQPVRPVRPSDRATAEGTSQAELLAAAGQRPGAVGGRLLIDPDAYPDPLDWLLAPLVGGASIVLCRHCSAEELARVAAAERVSHRLV